MSATLFCTLFLRHSPKDECDFREPLKLLCIVGCPRVNGKLEETDAESKSATDQARLKPNRTEDNKWNPLIENFGRDNPELKYSAWQKYEATVVFTLYLTLVFYREYYTLTYETKPQINGNMLHEYVRTSFFLNPLIYNSLFSNPSKFPSNQANYNGKAIGIIRAIRQVMSYCTEILGPKWEPRTLRWLNPQLEYNMHFALFRPAWRTFKFLYSIKTMLHFDS